MNKPINALQVNGSSENPFPECFHAKMGASIYRGLGDHFGLRGVGVNLEVILPGGSSGLKHWHTESEEFIYILSGTLILSYGTEALTMSAGDCIGFKANEKQGHRLLNRTDHEASFLVMGSRTDNDTVVYDEDDFAWVKQQNGRWMAAKKNGEPY